MTRSRLRQSVVKKTKKSLVLSIVGIVVIILLLVKLIPFLINSTAGSDTTNTAKNATTTTDAGYIPPPDFSIPFTATNTAEIKISGTSQPNQKVKIYVNNKLSDAVDTDAKGGFTFSGVHLQNGNNEIKAQAVSQQGKESDYSDPAEVGFYEKAPTLSIDEPSDGQTFKENNTVIIKGKTDPNVKVTVNGLWAIVDGNGNYSYTLTLKNGDNTITVVAEDPAGNQAKEERKVTYAP